MIWTHHLIRGMVIAPLLVPAVPATGAELDPYVGEWRGRGGLIAGSEPQRRLTCRLSVAAPSEQTLTVRGRCATAEDSRRFTTTITVGGDGSLTATTRAGTAVAREYVSTGRIGPSGLRFTGSDGETNVSMQLSRPASGEMEMRTTTDGPNRDDRSRVLFSRVSR